MDTVIGYNIEFTSTPVQKFLPGLPKWSETQKELISSEVENLLEKGAIVKVYPVQGQFISNLFLVQKKTGGFRPVINLRRLNEFVKYFHFKMETIETVKSLIQQGDFLCSLDMTDAYFSFLINENDRKFLRFEWDNVLYEFTCLCFGLKSAPRIFTKMMKVPISHLRTLGVRLSHYIDDSIIAGEDVKSCLNSTNLARQVLEDLGFTINIGKSQFIPSQVILYLGFLWNTKTMTLSLPQDKIDKILGMSTYCFSKNRITIRKLASLIGLYVSTFPAVLIGKFYYRKLEKVKISALAEFHSYEVSICLPNDAKDEIKWWIENLELHNGRPIKTPPIFKTIFCDASNSGWGAWCDFQFVHGEWSASDAECHINFLELKAVWLALLAFAESFSHVHLAIKTDNSTVVAYINNLGGIRSHNLNELSKKIWLWCENRKIFI